jgi:hypothetical protein
LAKEDFFDAYVSHVYSKSSNCDAMAGQARFECYLTHNSEVVDELRDGFHSFSQTFNGRPAWITEWNIKTVFDGLGNSTLQALYYADFALSLTLTPDVEIATYHNLLTSSTGYNLIAKDKSSSSADKDSHVARTAYPVAALLAPIYDGSFERISIPTGQFNSNVLTMACFQSAERKMFFIVNKSNVPLSLDGLGLEFIGDSKVSGIIGESLGGSQWSTETKNIKASETDKVTIRPYSVYRIELAQS